MTKDTNIQRVTITIRNKNGLHARPAMSFVDLANRYTSTIRLIKPSETPDSDPVTVDGKSIMNLLTLAATCGTEMILEAEGDDAEQAIGQLIDLVERKFDEE